MIIEFEIEIVSQEDGPKQIVKVRFHWMWLVVVVALVALAVIG